LNKTLVQGGKNPCGIICVLRAVERENEGLGGAEIYVGKNGYVLGADVKSEGKNRGIFESKGFS